MVRERARGWKYCQLLSADICQKKTFKTSLMFLGKPPKVTKMSTDNLPILDVLEGNRILKTYILLLGSPFYLHKKKKKIAHLGTK